MANAYPGIHTSDGGSVTIGSIVLGPVNQAADLLTLAHTEQEAQALLDGPADLVAQFAARVSRRIED